MTTPDAYMYSSNLQIIKTLQMGDPLQKKKEVVEWLRQKI